jgi:protein SCO1/2
MTNRVLHWQVRMWLLMTVGIVGLTGLRMMSQPGTGDAHAALPVLRAAPGFQLTDQHGRPVSRDALEGRAWVADFIFTSCPGQCLLMTDQFRALQRAFTQESLAFVSFSVDPGHDTPEVLAAYAQRHGGDPRWRLLTGPRDAIYQLCRDGFGLAADDAGAGADQPITHSVRLILVDTRGQVRGTYDATDGTAMARLRRDLRRLLARGA